MDPTEFGEILSKEVRVDENVVRYIVKHNLQIFLIDISADKTVNNVELIGSMNLKFTDFKLSEVLNSFKRSIGKNTLYILDGEVKVKAKELPAKPYSRGIIDKILTCVNEIMTVDIETIKGEDGVQDPYLITGYSPPPPSYLLV